MWVCQYNIESVDEGGRRVGRRTVGCVMSFFGLCSCSGEENGGEQGGEWISMMIMLDRTVLADTGGCRSIRVRARP